MVTASAHHRFQLTRGGFYMVNHKEQLMSMELYCSCSHRFTQMQASEYKSGTQVTPEMAIYRCALCGKSKIVVHEQVTWTNTLQHAASY